MDKGDWVTTVMALLSVVIGAALTVALDIARGQTERTQRRQDRRDDFQRDTLIELQDALDLLATRTGEMLVAYANGKPSPEQTETQRQSEARIILLRERVKNGEVRDAVEKYLQATRLVIAPDAEYRERAKDLNASMEPFNTTNERIGEQMRTL